MHISQYNAITINKWQTPFNNPLYLFIHHKPTVFSGPKL